MSLGAKAAKGALWTIVTSIGGRFIGVLGTLVMTRFLHPDIVGDVSVATITCMTMSWFTIWGFGQYTIVKGRGDDAKEVAWHATVAFCGLGAIGLGIAALAGPSVVSELGVGEAGKYIPLSALAIYIRRFGMVPERTLSRAMKFRAIGMSQFLGEATYTVVALTLASMGYKGMAIVYANVVQSLVVIAVLIGAANTADWATPHKLSWKRYKDMMRFGIPLAAQLIAHSASRYWDNVTVAYFFSAEATGTYNMAYNLADIPAIQIGEQIQIVLLPSMASLPPEARPRAVERSSALLSLILFPLAVGLGLVAGPLINLVLPSDKWQDVGPLLVVLTCLSVFRPAMFVLSAYMEANQRTTRLMVLEIAKLVVLIGGIAALAKVGTWLGLSDLDRLRLASSAVGISFGATSLVAAIIVSREGPRLGVLLKGFLQPLLACAVMAGAVVAVDRGLDLVGITHPAVKLVVEIVVGAVAFVPAALVICRETSRDLLGLLKKTLRRGKKTEEAA